MEGLYQSPPYSYLAQQHQQQQGDDYHQSTMYHHRPSFDNNKSASYHLENDILDPYNNSSHQHHHHTPPSYTNNNYQHSYYTTNSHPHANTIQQNTKPKITTNLWEDEGTLCFQVDAKGICVARRQDNDMINGTKLLNVVGMSRGKRDGILKNEKGRVVVKVGAMHLKGVWIPFNRATELAEKFKILDVLYPLFADEPSIYLNNNNNNNNNNNSNNNKSSEMFIPSPPLQLKYNNNNSCSPLLPAFKPIEDHHHNNSWDNKYYTASNPYENHQVLHRNSSSSSSSNSNSNNLDFTASSPVPTNNSKIQDQDVYSYYYHPSQEQQGTNRSASFDNSHHHYLYPPVHHSQNEKTSLYNASPYMKSSPYTTNNCNNNALTEENNAIPSVLTNSRNEGSTTPSSWLSPETPTAVLFQQTKEDSKKRKLSCSSTDTKVVKKVQLITSSIHSNTKRETI